MTGAGGSWQAQAQSPVSMATPRGSKASGAPVGSAAAKVPQVANGLGAGRPTMRHPEQQFSSGPHPMAPQQRYNPQQQQYAGALPQRAQQHATQSQQLAHQVAQQAQQSLAHQLQHGGGIAALPTSNRTAFRRSSTPQSANTPPISASPLPGIAATIVELLLDLNARLLKAALRLANGASDEASRASSSDGHGVVQDTRRERKREHGAGRSATSPLSSVSATSGTAAGLHHKACAKRLQANINALAQITTIGVLQKPAIMTSPDGLPEFEESYSRLVQLFATADPETMPPPQKASGQGHVPLDTAAHVQQQMQQHMQKQQQHQVKQARVAASSPSVAESLDSPGRPVSKGKVSLPSKTASARERLAGVTNLAKAARVGSPGLKHGSRSPAVPSAQLPQHVHGTAQQQQQQQKFSSFQRASPYPNIAERQALNAQRAAPAPQAYSPAALNMGRPQVPPPQQPQKGPQRHPQIPALPIGTNAQYQQRPQPPMAQHQAMQSPLPPRPTSAQQQAYQQQQQAALAARQQLLAAMSQGQAGQGPRPVAPNRQQQIAQMAQQQQFQNFIAANGGGGGQGGQGGMLPGQQHFAPYRQGISPSMAIAGGLPAQGNGAMAMHSAAQMHQHPHAQQFAAMPHAGKTHGADLTMLPRQHQQQQHGALDQGGNAGSIMPNYMAQMGGINRLAGAERSDNLAMSGMPMSAMPTAGSVFLNSGGHGSEPGNLSDFGMANMHTPGAPGGMGATDGMDMHDNNFMIGGNAGGVADFGNLATMSTGLDPAAMMNAMGVYNGDAMLGQANPGGKNGFGGNVVGGVRPNYGSYPG